MNGHPQRDLWYNELTLSVNGMVRVGHLDIGFESDKLRDEFNNQKLLIRRRGQRRAKKIRQRLDDLRAASTLEDMRILPGRCHELKGNLKGMLAVDLDHPYRLVFKPAHDPLPRKPDGGLDWKLITAVVIIDVEDYHG